MAFAPEIGSQAPSFMLKGVDGRNYSLSDFAGNQVVVIVVTCNHCPTAIQYEDRLMQLQTDYAPRGAQFVAINGNETEGHPTDDFPHMVQRAKEKGFNFPYLRDDTQDIMRALRAGRTPEAYVYDSDRKLRYHGRIDDNPDAPAKVKRHDLRVALDEVLAGLPVTVPKTPSVGCNVKWWGKDAHWMPSE